MERRRNQRGAQLPHDRKRILIWNATPAEIRFREILRKLDIPHWFQHLVFTENGFFILDFLIKRAHLIVELDGSAHLGRESYDAWRTDLILKTGKYRHFRLIRIQNNQVFNGEAERIIIERTSRMKRKKKRGPNLARWFASLPDE